MKQITVVLTIDSYHDVNLARLLLHASRALDQQAHAEGLKPEQLVDGNLAQASLDVFLGKVDVEIDHVAKPVFLNGASNRSTPR